MTKSALLSAARLVLVPITPKLSNHYANASDLLQCVWTCHVVLRNSTMAWHRAVAVV